MIPHVNESQNDFDEIDLKYQYQAKKVQWHHRILLNRPLKVIVVLFLVAVVAPLLVYQFCFFTSISLPPSDGYSVGSCLIPRTMRLACGVGSMSEGECHPHCCYDRNLNMCFHRLPSRFSYIMNQPWNENTILQPRIATVPYSFRNSKREIKLSIDEVSATHMTLTIYDSRNASFVGNRIYNKNYTYEVSSPELNIVVNATQGTIFDTARGPLIASDNIWEISFKLTNETMYGFGEIPMKIDTTKVIYSRDSELNSIPLIFSKVNGSFHGLLIDINDPIEIYIRPDQQIVIRSITNFGFKLHLFTGPEPQKIMQDVMKITGHNKNWEYWMLGIHICNEVPGLNLADFISATKAMPYDSHCGNGPIVFNSNQCKDSEISNINTVNEAANLVRNEAKRFVPHVSPYIRYIEEDNNEIINATTTQAVNEVVESCRIIPRYEDSMYHLDNFELYKGNIDGYDVVYPEYDLNPTELLDNLWAYDTEFDGLVLENSWPLDVANKSFNGTDLLLPYFNKNFEEAFEHTPQWNLTLVNSTSLYLFKHNQYGNNFANSFRKKVNNKPISSSSLFLNGRFAVNRQNVNTSWTDLHKELMAAALGGISGSWFWSSPICGDTNNYNPDNHANLCVKWYLAATYLPLIKIHSKDTPRHPLAFNGTRRAIITGALNRRLGLLPYYYTTLQEGPLLRPMFYQFPESEPLHDINTQFSVGESLIMIPNLQPFQSHVHMWLPPGSWYELWSGLKLKGKEGDPVTLATNEGDFFTAIRGGSILFIKREATLTAEDTRLMIPFSTIIALECIKGNENCHASGKLYVTPNMTLFFEATERNLTLTAVGDDFDPICDWFGGSWTPDLQFFYIYGLADEYNNYDNYRYVSKFTDLCFLMNDDELVVDFLS